LPDHFASFLPKSFKSLQIITYLLFKKPIIYILKSHFLGRLATIASANLLGTVTFETFAKAIWNVGSNSEAILNETENWFQALRR
jgi:hypothetical protein